MELESELDNEARKGAQIVKQARQADKKLQEALFNLDDSRKNNDRTQTAADALNSKLKKMRIQIEELVSRGNIYTISLYRQLLYKQQYPNSRN